MSEKNKYTAYCRDEFNAKQTIIVVANDRVEAKEIVLSNHPKYDVTSILSQEELEVVGRKKHKHNNTQ